MVSYELDGARGRRIMMATLLTEGDIQIASSTSPMRNRLCRVIGKSALRIRFIQYHTISLRCGNKECAAVLRR